MGLLSSWAAQQQMLEVQELEHQSRRALEVEGQNSLEVYGSCHGLNCGVG